MKKSIICTLFVFSLSFLLLSEIHSEEKLDDSSYEKKQQYEKAISELEAIIEKHHDMKMTDIFEIKFKLHKPDLSPGGEEVRIKLDYLALILTKKGKKYQNQLKKYLKIGDEDGEIKDLLLESGLFCYDAGDNFPAVLHMGSVWNGVNYFINVSLLDKKNKIVESVKLFVPFGYRDFQEDYGYKLKTRMKTISQVEFTVDKDDFDVKSKTKFEFDDKILGDAVANGDVFSLSFFSFNTLYYYFTASGMYIPEINYFLKLVGFLFIILFGVIWYFLIRFFTFGAISAIDSLLMSPLGYFGLVLSNIVLNIPGMWIGLVVWSFILHYFYWSSF
jgi:hypothetical protein